MNLKSITIFILGLLGLFLTSLSTVAAKELWNKNGFVISHDGGDTCSEVITLRIEAKAVSSFEDSINQLNIAVSSAMATLGFTCDKVENVTIKGFVNNVFVFKASAKKIQRWKLSAKPSPLEIEANALKIKVKTIEDLLKIKKTLDKYEKVPDIKNSFQYFVFLNAAKTVTKQILEEIQNTGFQASITKAYHKSKNIVAIRKNYALSLEVVSFLFPEKVKDLKKTYDLEISRYISKEWNKFLTTLLKNADIYEDAFEKIKKKASTLTLDSNVSKKLDERINEWVLSELATYRTILEKSYASHLSEKNKLADYLEKIDLPSHFTISKETLKIEAVKLRDDVNEGIVKLEQNIKTLISEIAKDYSDLGAVIQTGFAIAGELESAGFNDKAKSTLQMISKRSDQLIADGLQALKSELSRAEMTPVTITSYQQQAEIFQNLSKEYEGFKNYVIAIEDGIAAGRKRQCIVHSRQASREGQYLSGKILTGRGALSIEQLACALYRNDHVLQRFYPGWLFFSAVLEINTKDGGTQKFILQKSSEDESLYGTTLVSESEQKFNEQEWIETIDRLVIRPPSGKPNAKGITECDMLAGDPDDPSKVSNGVDLENVSANYDFDRAIEACVAAIEYNSNEIRFYHNLTRILYVLGVEGEAKKYAAFIAEEKYPAGLYLNAQIRMMDEGDDAFYDAIDFLKAAASAQHPAAKKMLAELIPEGTDFYRPLPNPTEKEVMSAVKTSHCSPNIFGVQMCVYMTGVQSKDCFQTSATDFSCELVFNIRCAQTGSARNPILGLVTRSCPPSSDVKFYTLRKAGNGSWASYEQ